MKNKKIILYIFFSLIIVVSGVIFFIDYNKNNSNNDLEIYEPTPSELSIDDKDKKTVIIDNASIKMAPDVDLDAERKKHNNNDIIGRLEIPDLFNVLVVKGTDNKFYLTHDVNKKYDIRGNEFIDYRVNPTRKQVNIWS